MQTNVDTGSNYGLVNNLISMQNFNSSIHINKNINLFKFVFSKNNELIEHSDD